MLLVEVVILVLLVEVFGDNEVDGAVRVVEVHLRSFFFLEVLTLLAMDKDGKSSRSSPAIWSSATSSSSSPSSIMPNRLMQLFGM